jgi:hypothetical protein
MVWGNPGVPTPTIVQIARTDMACRRSVCFALRALIKSRARTDPSRCPSCRERVTPFAAGCALCGADLDPRRWDSGPGLAQRAGSLTAALGAGPRAGGVGRSWSFLPSTGNCWIDRAVYGAVLGGVVLAVAALVSLVGAL